MDAQTKHVLIVRFMCGWFLSNDERKAQNNGSLRYSHSFLSDHQNAETGKPHFVRLKIPS